LPTLDERRHDDAEWLVLLRDGKSFADDQVVIALGVTTTGENRILGLVQTATENTRGCAAFLCELVERGFQTPAGLLVVLDGAKGLSAATREGFGERVPIQRGQWHKREHVLSDLPKTLHALRRRKRQGAYAKSTDGEAQRALRPLVTDLEKHNVSAAPSLEEGLDETLTLHRLDVGRPGVHLEGRRLGRPCLRTSRWRLPENVAACLVAAVIGGIDIRSLTPELRSLTP
jgi:transposase-like protein